ncbi:uncharacterized protein METZ01_LOCUS61805 [marine metagenome]|uniref:Uncharacterized protein n=1 Tax=marine metagenome TaxID=408172 RepID=A0A381T064_9ZZZZ
MYMQTNNNGIRKINMIFDLFIFIPGVFL